MYLFNPEAVNAMRANPIGKLAIFPTTFDLLLINRSRISIKQNELPPLRRFLLF